MRVRIKQDPFKAGVWDVQTKHWWSFGWVSCESYWGSDAQELALKAAVLLHRPNTIEVEK